MKPFCSDNDAAMAAVTTSFPSFSPFVNRASYRFRILFPTVIFHDEPRDQTTVFVLSPSVLEIPIIYVKLRQFELPLFDYNAAKLTIELIV